MLAALASTGVSIGITSAMLEPILEYVTGNIAVIMPVGIAVMGIMIGVGLIPTIIKKFTNA